MKLDNIRNSLSNLSLRKKAKFVRTLPPSGISPLEAIESRLRDAEIFILDPENDYVSEAVSTSTHDLRIDLDALRVQSEQRSQKAPSKKAMEREVLEIARLNTDMSKIETTLEAQRTIYTMGQSSGIKKAASRHSSELSTVPSDSKNIVQIEIDDVFHTYDVDPVPRHQGSFGCLYVAKCEGKLDLALKRPLTIGIPDEDNLRRFRREAAIWRRLRHPNILRFYGEISWDGKIHLVSPFEEQGNLHTWILAHPQASRMNAVKDVANGLKFMHTLQHDDSAPVVHGDIKAINCVVGRQNVIMICDFGLSKEVGGNTSQGQIGQGSARWQAPELWEDGSHKSTESDVYAFAMLITEVLTGKLPFGQMLDSAVIHNVSSKDSRPKQLPLSNESSGEDYSLLWSIASRCWSRKAEDRLKMIEVLEELN